ncbi:MAG TPA: inorganic diphosphatase [Lacipirellulaceae bacterium]|jgi:inorganic pyrophosphatase|nr:inorganic diphosphatase [Lacipirellulaceae bacterium]
MAKTAGVNKRRAGKKRSSPFKENGLIDFVVETPKGKRNKFKFDEKLGKFRLCKVLPAGASFPYDFGFVPGTRGDDGDPLDVLILMDESAFPGCIVEGQLIGVIEAEQEDDGELVRNDRLVAVASDAHDYGNIKTLSDINEQLLKELEHFFKSCSEAQGKTFNLLANRGPKSAKRLVKNSIVSVRKVARHPK